MKICPSCGAELDDSATKCPICDAAIPETVPSLPSTPISIPAIDISAKLAEMREKIEKLKSSPGPEAPKPEEKAMGETPPEKGVGPVPALTSEAAPAIERTEEAAKEEVEEEVEEEYEEIIVETRQIGEGVIDRESIINLGKPKQVKEEATGRKIPKEETKKTHTRVRPSYIILAILVVAIVIIASFLVLTNRPELTPPAVDGIWDDWVNVPKYPALFTSENPSLNIDETAVQLYKGSIFWYLHTAGDLYKTSERISYYALLIDSDGDPGTGFSFYPGFGADYMAMISGCGGESLFAGLYVFGSDDNLNWSAWKSVKSIHVAALISKFETNFTAPQTFSSAHAKFVSVTFDGKSNTCMSVIYSLIPGVLMITQGSLVPSTGVLLQEPNQHLLQLVVRAYGAMEEVRSIVPSVIGANTVDLGEVIWKNKDEMRIGKTLTLSVDCSSLTPGTKITAYIDSEGIETDYPVIMILGSPAIGYVGSIPSGITIDGIFADWNNFTLDMGDAVPPANKNIDITRTALSNSTTDIFFFGEVRGRMLNGSLVPVKESVLSPGSIGGSFEVRERVTGEDLLQIFLDVNPFDDIGAPSPIANATIEPDYLIEISGRNGIILQKAFYEWNGDQWLQDELVGINAAVNSQQIELGISKDAIGATTGMDMAIISTDWLGSRDDLALDSVAIDPFKISLQGKIWGSLDGTSWIPKSDVLNGTDSLVDLTSDSYGNLYAIFSNGTVYVSHDLANSWTKLIASSSSNFVAITSDGSGQLYSIKSTGETYNANFTGNSWIYRGKIVWATDIVDIDWSSGTSPGTACLYAVRSTPGTKLARSDDGGLNWSQYKNKLPTASEVSAIAAINVLGQDVIYVLERDGDLYVSNDSGTTWSTTHISPGGSHDFVASPCVDLDIDSNGNLWVVRAKGEVYRLITSTWSWETLYGLNDTSNVTAISSVPIPEFQSIFLLLAICVMAPLVCLRRYSRKMR